MAAQISAGARNAKLQVEQEHNIGCPEKAPIEESIYVTTHLTNWIKYQKRRPDQPRIPYGSGEGNWKLTFTPFNDGKQFCTNRSQQ